MIKESNDESAPGNTYSPNSLRTDLDLRLQEMIDAIKVREAQVSALESTTQSMKDKLALLAAKQKEYRMLRADRGGRGAGKKSGEPGGGGPCDGTAQ